MVTLILKPKLETFLSLQHQILHLGMVTDLLNGRPEQNHLENVEVLGHHGTHVYIRIFHKTLYGNFEFVPIREWKLWSTSIR